jgi:hypothetical protein
MIAVTEESAGAVIRVDGWLAGDGVAELERVLESAGAPVCLLLRDLRGADAAGLSLLRRLAGEGATIEALSPYMQLLLAAPADLDPLPSSPPGRPETRIRSDRT